MPCHVDCMTKNMPPDAMLEYLKTQQYAFKYDDVIKHTKRAVAKKAKNGILCDVQPLFHVVTGEQKNRKGVPTSVEWRLVNPVHQGL